MDVDAAYHRPHVFNHRTDVVDKVRLVEDDHRCRTAVPGDYEVALDSARVEVTIEARYEKHDIDVGSDYLLFGRASGSPSRKPAEPRKDCTDARIAGITWWFDRDPVADRRKVNSGFCLMSKPPRHACQPLPRLADHTIDVGMFQCDACGHESFGCMRSEGFR